jgi:hypothetical protein
MGARSTHIPYRPQPTNQPLNLPFRAWRGFPLSSSGWTLGANYVPATRAGGYYFSRFLLLRQPLPRGPSALFSREHLFQDDRLLRRPCALRRNQQPKGSVVGDFVIWIRTRQIRPLLAPQRGEAHSTQAPRDALFTSVEEGPAALRRIRGSGSRLLQLLGFKTGQSDVIAPKRKPSLPVKAAARSHQRGPATQGEVVFLCCWTASLNGQPVSTQVNPPRGTLRSRACSGPGCSRPQSRCRDVHPQAHCTQQRRLAHDPTGG